MSSGANLARVAAALILALLPAVQGALAEGAGGGAPAWGLQQLMSGMAEVKSESRQFTERKYLAMLTAPLESSGVLIYKAPGHLEKHTLLPRDERMVLDQGIIVLESRSRHLRRTFMATQYPGVGVFVESMRATLAGDLTALNHYYRATLEGRAGKWRLQLVPNDPAAREMVREIRIEGSGSRITDIEITEPNGDRTVMTVGEDVTTGGERQQ